MERTASRTGTISDRASRLRRKLLSAPYEIDIERARAYTEAWQKADGELPCMKAALALRHALRTMSISIDDDELLAGAKTAKRLAGVIPVERGDFNTVLKLELARLVSRERHRFHISDRELEELEGRILPYWKGRTAREKKADLWKKSDIYSPMRLDLGSLYRILKGVGLRKTGKVLYLTLGRSLKSIPHIRKMERELAALRPNLALTVFDVQGHFVPGYRRVLELGFNGLVEWAERELQLTGRQSVGSAQDSRDFYCAVKTACEAVCDFSERYAELVEELASAADEPRRSELLEMGARCRRVPAEPPRDFMEALQSMWMTQVATGISYGMAGILSVGRADQYLGPYYESDLAAGRVTRERALEALEEYMVKLATEIIMLIETGKETASEMGVGSNTLTVGGVDGEGRCAVNEVSHLLIEAYTNVKALANNLCVRVSRNTPDDFLELACRAHRDTSGIALFNDELIIAELEQDGFSTTDARDYSIVGCVEPTATGNCFACTAGNDISLVGVLEMALNQGRMLFSGGRVGAATPNPGSFSSFEDVMEAFREQIAFNIKTLVDSVEMLDRVYAEAFPSPLVSATVKGCMESGRDITRGGAHYNFGSITGRGLGTVANSLAAIRWAVFEEKLLTMEELTHALQRNFRGNERERSALLRRSPKYGNDDPAADELARWVTDTFCREVRRHPCGRGGFYRPGIFSYGVHVVDGLYLGATPDGRLAGEPVSNGISPANGTERKGPTAVMKSAAAACCPPLSDGSALNIRLSPGLLAGTESTAKLSALIRGYFELGGRHVQFNVVDTATLEDARDHPERYPDLVVRVSGYCAYFTDLGRSIQDDIIARTEFGVL